jgi:putative Holliday junction resolvase
MSLTLSDEKIRIMGLDVGKRRVGVAISDELKITAQPLTKIKRTSIEKDLTEILHIASEYSVRAIVVGLPLNMDGSVGPQASLVLKFMESLKQKTSLPVEGWDERLSTVAVTRVLIEGDVTRKKRKGIVDQLSASYILQGYLDSKKAGGQTKHLKT